MILSIRSLKELSLVTKSREKFKIKSRNIDLNESKQNVYQQNKHKGKKDSKLIDLPNIPKLQRRKWVKSKEALSKFFNELDYNNQIQSSYDLTLLERQRCHDKNNVA